MSHKAYISQQNYKKSEEISKKSKKLELIVSALTPMFRKVCNHLLLLSSKNLGHRFVRKAIGNLFGVSEATVKRAIKLLEDSLLLVVDRKFKRANAYRVGPAALNGYVRSRLAKYLPAILLFLNVSFLLSRQSNDPLFIKNNNNQSIESKKKKISGEHSPFVQSQLEFIQALDVDMSDNIPKKGSSMPAELSLFRPVVEDLSSCVLTPLGKAKVSAFSTNTIIEADRRFAQVLSKRRPTNEWGYFVSVLNAVAKERQETPDHQYAFEIINRLSLSEIDPKIESIKIDISSSSHRSLSKSNRSIELERLKEREIYDKEQLDWKAMNDNEKKEFLRPKVAQIAARGVGALKFAQGFTPFPDSETIFNLLVLEYMTKDC